VTWTPTAEDDRRFLSLAIEQARKSWDEGGVPIGAVLVHDGEVLAAGHNQRVQKDSAILHGETDTIEKAGRLRASVYRESVLYTTLSPCIMCSGTALLYEIPRIVVGENRTFEMAEDLLRERGVIVDVLDDPECVALMERMIAERPEIWSEDIGVETGELGASASDGAAEGGADDAGQGRCPRPSSRRAPPPSPSTRTTRSRRSPAPPVAASSRSRWC
jgi:cytosine deaminase